MKIQHTGPYTGFKKWTIWSLGPPNSVLRSLTGLHRDTSVSVLTAKSGQLSVHQRTALSTVTLVYKALATKEPSNIFQTLQPQPSQRMARHQLHCRNVDYNLSISRGSFMYRGSKLFNQLPVELVRKTKLTEFKKGAKEWVNARIPFLPP